MSEGSSVAQVALARGPDGDLARWSIVLREDGSLLACRSDGPLGEPRVVACVSVAVARLEDGLWESRLRIGALTLPVSAGERASVERMLGQRVVGSTSEVLRRDPDREWRRLHLQALREGKTPRRRLELTPASRALTERERRLLWPAGRHLLVDSILEQMWPTILSLRVESDREAGLSRRHEVDPASSTVMVARTFGYVAHALGLPSPRLFLRTDVAGGLAHLPVWPLATLSGNTLVSGFSPREVLFAMGHHVVAYTATTMTAVLVPDSTSLAGVLQAALRLGGAIGAGDRATEQVAAQLATRIQPAQLDALRRLCAKLAVDLPRAELRTVLADVAERWLTAVAHTRARAGLLLCDELEAALRMLDAMGRPWATSAAREDLERFWLSDELSTLRGALGW